MGFDRRNEDFSSEAYPNFTSNIAWNFFVLERSRFDPKANSVTEVPCVAENNAFEVSAEEGVLSSHRISGSADTQLSVASIMLSDLASIGSRLEKLLRLS